MAPSWKTVIRRVLSNQELQREANMKRHLIVGLPAALFLLSMVSGASADPPTKANNPLVLKEQGNFYVGGRIELRSPNTTNAANRRRNCCWAYRGLSSQRPISNSCCPEVQVPNCPNAWRRPHRKHLYVNPGWARGLVYQSHAAWICRLSRRWT